ncbi:hypothetical protein ACI2TP_19595 [Ralstonia nicotianae]
MAYSDSTTIGEISRLSAKVLDANDIFNIGKRGVARIFLRELLELKADSSDAELELAYKSCSPRGEIPANSEDFWVFVEKEYLHLEMEPKLKFIELSFRVNEDLAAVAVNLDYIKKELDSLEGKRNENGRLTADDRYYRNQLEYFKEKNLVAKNEIVDFMTHKIKRRAIINASVKHPVFSRLGSFLLGDSPYAFARRMAWALADPYDVRSLDVYSNKFMDLPVSEYKEMVAECKVSPEKFKENAIAYIKGVPGELKSIREKVEALIERTHILFSRKQVIGTMLRHFEEKDYISFVSMAPLQIEGIFADICRGIGVTENQLDISSLNDKLQHIDGKMKDFFFFEYYSFKFPVLRNLVAHGGLVDGELEDTAIHLMLDLLPVCELTASEELPINHALKVLDGASKGRSEKLVKWLSLRDDVEIPDFYAVKAKITATEILYTSPDFWDYLEGELRKLKDVGQVRRSEPVKVAGMLKSSGIAVERAEQFLKSSGHIVREAIKKKNETLEKFNSALTPKSEKSENGAD